jgi:type I restriction enzyme R subunit
VQTLSRLNRTYPGKTTYVLDFANENVDVLTAFKVYFEGAHLTQVGDPNLVFDQWDKLEAVGVFSDVDVQATAKAYFGDGATKPSQGRLSASLAPVRDRFNAAYRRALDDKDSGEVDRLDTFRRDLHLRQHLRFPLGHRRLRGRRTGEAVPVRADARGGAQGLPTP